MLITSVQSPGSSCDSLYPLLVHTWTSRKYRMHPPSHASPSTASPHPKQRSRTASHTSAPSSYLPSPQSPSKRPTPTPTLNLSQNQFQSQSHLLGQQLRACGSRRPAGIFRRLCRSPTTAAVLPYQQSVHRDPQVRPRGSPRRRPMRVSLVCLGACRPRGTWGLRRTRRQR